MDSRYFHVRKQGDRFITSGITSCCLGHKIEYPGQKKPDGIFAQWSWDGRKFTLQNDRYGFYPVYYYCTDKEFAISSSIPRLIKLGADKTLDEAGLSVFIRLGFFIGDDTPFKNIRAIPPCSVFVWDNGQLRILSDRPVSNEIRINRAQAVDDYISLFRQAIERRLPAYDDFALTISGGKDSRHILLELFYAGYPPRYCVTAKGHPSTYAQDTQIARQLTDSLDLELITLEQPKAVLPKKLRKNLHTNFCSDEHDWYLVVADYLKGKTRINYDGIGGDVLSDNLSLPRKYLTIYHKKNFSEVAERILIREREPMLEKMMPARQYQRFHREKAREHLINELKKHVYLPNPLNGFYFFNRTRREIALAPYALLSEVGTVFSPYLDHDLYNFLSSLPPEIIENKNFHAEAINRAFPEHSLIPFSERKKNFLYSRKYALKFSRELINYLSLHPGSDFVRSSYIFPRLLRCLVDRRYSRTLIWFGPLVTYLVQLERFCRDEENG